MASRAFAQVDVFGSEPLKGNPVAVVLDGDGLHESDMRRVANWTNLSETTFVLPPTSADADYRVRIFTPSAELPFAGHPTLGTCHAWLQSGGGDVSADRVVQECDAGLVEIRRTDDGLAFAAPAPVHEGPVDEVLLAEVLGAFEIERDDVVDAQWTDNGPGWLALLLGSAEHVLAVEPAFLDRFVGVLGPHDAEGPAAIEVRAFFPNHGIYTEDPVTGSLNASLAQWLLGSGRLEAPYIARQGTALGRDGRVYVSRDDVGTIWIAGATTTVFTGTASL